MGRSHSVSTAAIDHELAQELYRSDETLWGPKGTPDVGRYFCAQELRQLLSLTMKYLLLPVVARLFLPVSTVSLQ